MGLNIRFLPKLTPMKLISKLLLLCLSLLTSQGIFSQSEAELLKFKQANEDHLVCGLSKDVVLQHSTPPLKILSDYPSSAQFDCGKFKVFYADLLSGAPAGGFADPILGATRRSTFCAVLNYVESVFDLSNVPDNSIRIEVEPSWITTLNPAPTSVTYNAYASAHYGAALPNHILGGKVYDFITTSIDPALSSEFHAYMKVNFSAAGGNPIPIPWLNDHTQNVSSCQLDLFYILLHEVGHILGFASLANNEGDLFTNSISLNNNFSRLDFLMHYNNSLALTATNLEKFILGTPTTAYLNPALSAMTSINNNTFWISGNEAPNNHPVYSGSYSGTPISARSILGHLDEQILSYSYRSRNAPGYAENYVMGTFGIKGAVRRNFTDAEIKIFIELGYSLNPLYVNPGLNNLPPYSNKIGGDADYPKSYDTGPQQMYAESVDADETIANNSGASVTFNLWQDADIEDPEGQPLTVADGTLTNIRGCGNGGNNHAQLYLSADKESITFTPRPNFIGRAQFAFRLFDGVKIGSWHLYTVDVQTGNNVNYSIGSNIVINGNLEEGTEVRRTGAEINNAYTSIAEDGMREGFMRGYHYSDANPVNSVGNPWYPYGGGDFVRNSTIECSASYPSSSGVYSNSFPNAISNNPIPPSNMGDRYRNIYDKYNYFGLGTAVQTCHKYILKFDYANKPQLYNLNLTSYPVTFGFTNNPTYPAIPGVVNTFVENLAPIAIDTWMHKEIPFNYCAQSPSNFLNIQGFAESYNGLLFDNIQIVEVSNFPLLTVSIAGGTGEICAGTPTTLTAVVSNQFCNPTYAWSNGMTTASISVSPNTTQTYTVVVSDGCNSQSAFKEVVVIGSYVEPISNYSVCANTNSEIINFIGAGGVDFEWTNSNPSIGLNTSGTGAYIPSFVAQNNSNAVLSGIITVTPPSTNGCIGTPISFTINVGNTQPVVNSISNYVFCSNINTSSIAFGGTTGASYSWTNSNPSIGLASSGTGSNIPSFFTQNNTSSPITASIIVTASLTGCVGNIVTFNIIVDPLPAIDNIADQTVCANSIINEITFLGSNSSAFLWVNSNPSIGLQANGIGTSISSFVAQNSLNSPMIASITVTPSLNSCFGNPTTFTITVNPLPVIDPIANQTLCANSAASAINFTGTPLGTTFEWANSNPSIGLNASGTGNSILSFVAQNSSNSPENSTILVTATNSGCLGEAESFTITVNPIPVIDPIADQSICVNNSTDNVIFSTSIIGSSFEWNNSNAAIGLGASGNADNIPSFVGENATSSSISGTVTVIPFAPNGCIGNSASFTISINPIPTVEVIANQILCANISTSLIDFIGLSGTNYTWTNTNISTGLSANGNGNSIAAFVSENNSLSPIFSEVTVSPAINGCVGNPTTFTITVNPLPVIDPILDQTFCENTSSVAVNFNSSLNGTTFQWTNTNTSIGLVSMGSGSSIESFITANPTSDNISATVTIIPSSLAGCVGNSVSFDYNINIQPEIQAISNIGACNGEVVNSISFSGNSSNIAYSWTNSTPSIGLAASGLGDVPSFTAVNSGNQPVTAQITVDASLDGCNAATQNFEITVNPSPVLNSYSNVTFCEKTEVPSIPIVSNPTGATIDWTNSNTAIGVPASGTGDFPSFTATNDDLNGNAIFSTVTVTPTLNGCVGSTVSFTITINNEPILDPILDQEFCSNSIADVNDFSTIPVGSTYTWTSSNAAIGLATSGSGDIPLFNAINATTGLITSTINVTPTINGCVGEEVSFLVTIKPTPKIDPVSNQTLCANSATSAINFTGTSGATFNWVNSNSTIGLATSGTGNIPSFTATNSSSVPSVATISATATVNGCTSNAANFTITVNPNPVLNTVSNQTLCANTATVPIVFSSTPASSLYSWTNSNTAIGLAAGGSGNIPSFTATNSTTAPIIGIISVKAKVNGCISNTITFTITVNPLPIITVTPPLSTITPGLSANLVASGAVSYSWSPASGLSCTNCPNPVASPNTTTTYTVTGTNANGCSSSTAAQVFVEQIVSCSVCPNILGSNLTSTSIIPAKQTYCVNSNVNIFGNVLFRTSEFKMASNVTIFVQPGALLTIQGCHLYSCGDMWKGIVVLPGGRLVIENGTTPTNPIISNITSLIEDAIIAIKVENHWLVTNILQVNNVLFNKNQTGIRISNYTSNLTTNPFDIVNCTFTSRRIGFPNFDPLTTIPLGWWPQNTTADFRAAVTVANNLGNGFINNTTYSQIATNSFLKAPFAATKPIVGLELINVGTTQNVGTPTAPTYNEFSLGSATNMNIFDNQKYGVWLTNSNFKTVNSVYQNTGKKGVGIYAQSDANNNNRLRVVPVLTVVGGNKFADCETAIRTEDYFEVSVQYADVRSTQANWDQSSTKWGFQLNTNRFYNYSIRYNNMYNVTSAVMINTDNDLFSLNGAPIFGQFAGRINVDYNTIRPHLATATNVTSQYVANAITLSNSGFVTHLINGAPSVISTNTNWIRACRGIFATNWKRYNVQCQNNNITVLNNSNPVPGFSQIYYGISVNNSLEASANGCFIRQNNVTGFYTPTANSNPNNDPNLAGIVSSLCQRFAVTCNTTSNTTRGIGFNGWNASTIFRNNTMQNHRYGFFLDQVGSIDQQGTITAPADNRWTGIWLPGNFRTATLGSSNAQNSKLWVRTGTNTFTYNPNGSSFSSPSNFAYEYTLPNFALGNCPLPAPIIDFSCFQIIPFPFFLKSLEKVVEDSIIYSDASELSEKMRYISKNMVYEVAKFDNMLLDSSTVLSDFYNVNLFLSPEKVYQIQKQMRMGNLFDAIAANVIFIPENNIEENYKRFNEIYIKYKDGLNMAEDSLDLMMIALKCPFYEGVAVYQARALYNLIFDEKVEFIDICPTEGEQKSLVINVEPENIFNGIKIYPNPAKNQVFISLNNSEITSVQISIMDVNGKVYYSQSELPVSGGIGSFQLDIAEGLYFVKIINPITNEIFLQKLFIQK